MQAFHMAEYTVIFLFSRFIRYAQKRDCLENNTVTWQHYSGGVNYSASRKSKTYMPDLLDKTAKKVPRLSLVESLTLYSVISEQVLN